jgi:hypothetical protein
MVAILASALLLSVALIVPTQIALAHSNTKDQKASATGDSKIGQEVNQRGKCIGTNANCIQTATNILCMHSICIFGSVTPFIYPIPH